MFILYSWSEPPPFFIKGGMRFFKKGCNGGWDWKVLLEMERKPGMGGLVLKCEDEKFFKSLYIVGRWLQTPYFMKTP